MATKHIPDHVYDLVIVGGGPAGFTAGLYGSRAGLRTLLIEGASTVSQITVTDLIENYPGIPEGINGLGLIEKFKSRPFSLDWCRSSEMSRRSAAGNGAMWQAGKFTPVKRSMKPWR